MDKKDNKKDKKINSEKSEEDSDIQEKVEGGKMDMTKVPFTKLPSQSTPDLKEDKSVEKKEGSDEPSSQDTKPPMKEEKDEKVEVIVPKIIKADPVVQAPDSGVKTSLGSTMQKLQLPFDFRSLPESPFEIEPSQKKRYSRMVMKDKFRIKLDTFANFSLSFMNNFWLWVKHFDGVYIHDGNFEQREYTPTYYSHNMNYLEVEHMVLDNKNLTAAFKPWVEGRTATVTDYKKGRPVEFEISIPMDRHSKALIDVMQTSNLALLSEDDVLRRWVSSLASKDFYVPHREVGDDLTDLRFYLPKFYNPECLHLLFSTSQQMGETLWSFCSTRMNSMLNIPEASSIDTFHKLASALDVNPSTFSQVNAVTQAINTAAGATFMRDLTTVSIYNRFFQFRYASNNDTFNLSLLLDIICCKMLVPMSCIDVASRAWMNNYLCNHLFANIAIGNKRYTDQFRVNGQQMRDPSRISSLDPILNDLQEVVEARGGFNMNEIRQAFANIFQSWSRESNIYNDADHAEDELIEVLPTPHVVSSEFSNYMFRRTNNYISTSDHDVTNSLTPSVTTKSLVIIADLFNKGFMRLETANAKVNKGFKAALNFINDRYVHLQGYAYTYNRYVLQRLAMTPLAHMLSDKEQVLLEQNRLIVNGADHNEGLAADQPRILTFDGLINTEEKLGAIQHTVTLVPYAALSAVLGIDIGGITLTMEPASIIEDDLSFISSLEEWFAIMFYNNALRDATVDDLIQYKAFVDEVNIAAEAIKNVTRPHKLLTEMVAIYKNHFHPLSSKGIEYPVRDNPFYEKYRDFLHKYAEIEVRKFGVASSVVINPADIDVNYHQVYPIERAADHAYNDVPYYHNDLLSARGANPPTEVAFDDLMKMFYDNKLGALKRWSKLNIYANIRLTESEDKRSMLDLVKVLRDSTYRLHHPEVQIYTDWADKYEMFQTSFLANRPVMGVGEAPYEQLSRKFYTDGTYFQKIKLSIPLNVRTSVSIQKMPI